MQPLTREEIESLNEHPELELFTRTSLPKVNPGSKLYLLPTSHGEVFDIDFAPNPSPLSELPNVERWTLTYIVMVIEVLSRRRSIQQLSRSTHRVTYNSLSHDIGSLKEVPKIMKIHRGQPIEGVVEMTVTLKFSDRVRVLVARFEGVDRRWICTEFAIL
jgi:hypothetical protein